MPVTEVSLLRFCAAQACRLSYKTIKVYLSAVQFWSSIAGHTIAFNQLPLLYYVLRGIRRTQGNRFTRPRRLPITIFLLRTLHRRVQLQTYTHLQQLMFRAASSLAFFGLLRCSEYTCSHRTSFTSASTLLVNDIWFSPTFHIMYVRIKASKTDPFRVGCTLRIAAISDPLCPVTRMRQYLSVHPTHSGPLFVMSHHTFLIRADMVLFLRRGLPDVANINTHSFRIGGASTAACVGVPDSRIQILGRWSTTLTDNIYIYRTVSLFR